jgi:hypothetical protein
MTLGLKTVAAIASLLAPLLQAAEADRVGAKLAPWKPGQLDIHQISTGRGNAALHHGSIDPASPFFLDALRPRVHIIPSWRPSHPAPVVLKRIMTPSAYEGERDVFTVALRQSTRTVIGPRADRIKNANGHVVVRVDPGGETYRVVCLDDTRESYEVISVHGPYASR